jgi:L-aspartate oxidase
MRQRPEYFCDVFIVGSGAAGLSLALRLASHCQVLLVSQGPISQGATYYAQGGIATVFDETDTLQAHCQDTLTAGAGLCDPAVVEFVVHNARHCINWLIDQGMRFDQDRESASQGFHLTREGGHSHRRILHVADTTGQHLSDTLTAQARLQKSLRIIESCSVIDLLTHPPCQPTQSSRIIGAMLWQPAEQSLTRVSAKVVVLATGGASSLYWHNTSTDRAFGEGIALAWRAGCRVANLEFNQFHPTTLYHPQAPNLLLTEALRGEGAWLCRPDGSRFMPDVDARAELAPRDIVACAMQQEMERLSVPCLYLDIRHQPAALIQQHFPALYRQLRLLDLDLTQQPIPVVPAAHYTCGGVVVDQHGRSDVAGLYAIGEVSYTGLHGANRLASNALLECLVYAWSAAEAILQQLPCLTWSQSVPTNPNRVMASSHATSMPLAQEQRLRTLMWQQVGLVRTTTGLNEALLQIKAMQTTLELEYPHPPYLEQVLALRNKLQVAQLMVRCALERRESRGGHYRQDYPVPLPHSTPTILSPTQR